VRGSEIGSTGS